MPTYLTEIERRVDLFGVIAGPFLRRKGWHFGTVPKVPRPKKAPRYGGDRRNRRWIDRYEAKANRVSASGAFAFLTFWSGALRLDPYYRLHFARLPWPTPFWQILNTRRTGTTVCGVMWSQVSGGHIVSGVSRICQCQEPCAQPRWQKTSLTDWLYTKVFDTLCRKKKPSVCVNKD